MSKNYSVDDILNEYKNDEPVVQKKPAGGTLSDKKLQDTGYIPIPKGAQDADITMAYNLSELEEINPPERKPSPSHASGKFQVSDISRPNVSYIHSVKEVIPKQADLPPRPTDTLSDDYDGAVVTKTTSDEDYIPKVRKMSNSTRAKEMRQKRKKKKQPEFTYDRESPDGVYTRPQAKQKKFVVSRGEKPKKVDAMAPVDLSSNAAPEALDVSIESRPELRSVNTDEPKTNQNNTIKDYDSFEDAREIKNSIVELRSGLSFRLVVLTVLFIFSAFISFGTVAGLPVPALLTPQSPRTFSIVSLIIAILAMAVSLDTIKSGLLKLLSFKADTDSLAAFGTFMSAVASGVCAITPALVESGKVHIYTPIAVMSMFINALGKRLILKRAELNFEFASRERNKHAVCIVEDDIRSESLTRGTIGDYPVLTTMRKINFMKDFSKYTFSTDSADKICRPLVPLIIIFSMLASIAVTFIKVKSIDATTVSYTLSIFTLYISACSCMGMPLIANIPLGKAAKQYARNHGVLLGYQSVEDFYDANSLLVDATKLFPTGSVSLASIKLFSDTKIDEVLLDAASLTTRADSILKDLFIDIIAGKNGILKKVENFSFEDSMGLCGWIDNKRILLGSRELMHSHNIEGVPTKTKEREFTEGGKDALYLSVSGNLAAVLIIEVSASPAVKKAMKELEKRDMAVIIKTIDPFITINRVSTLYNFSEELLKVVPTRMLPDFEEETRKVRKFSTPLACSGKFSSLVSLLMSAKAITKTASLGVFIQSASALLGMGIVSMHSLLGAFADLSPAWMLVYNIICTTLTVLIIMPRKV